jgi:predicted alpha-1,2-mannosidase
MFKNNIILIIFILFNNIISGQDLTSFVNPMIGTGGVGHTYPGATVPFGMVQLSPDTRVDGSWEGCSGYYYPDSLIYGFSHTHLSGTGCSDYGDVMFLPCDANASFNPKEYRAAYNHKNEFASPGFYKVTFNNKIQCELTASKRCGVQRYSFPTSISPALLLDLMHRDKVLGSSIKIVSSQLIQGYRKSEAWAHEQYVYFSIELSEPFQKLKLMGSNKLLTVGDSISSDSIKILILFDQLKDNKLVVKTGISAVSSQNASLNLNGEINDKSFDEVRLDARSLWNKELSKIKVTGSSEKNRINFYTSLYHTMIVPNVFSDIDGRYRGRDNKIHDANGYTYYSVFSLWDTFRAAHPLYALIDKKRSLDFIKTFLAQYEQGGRLPVWELGANETDCMIGYHSVSVIADAITKDITDFSIPLALKAAKKSAEWNHLGLKEFNSNNFLQVDDESESVSKALEYAYDDWCIARIAEHQKSMKDVALYDKRAASYINQYDEESGFMRPRKNGAWYSPFDPREVNNHYTEANSYQYSFFVLQDIPGLISLMGGADSFDKKLDGLFNASATTTGRTQADITGMIGQYAHGNEPSHHMAYLYDYIGKPWKSQEVIHRIVDSLYHPVEDGLPGNEDCGQMSAWYVWSALGFYPVTPGNTSYAIGTPLFDHAAIQLENGKQIDISTSRESEKSIYVHSLTLDGKLLDLNFIDYSQIKNGAKLVFDLKDQPNYLRGTQVQNYGTLNTSNFVKAPIIKTASRSFSDSMKVSIEGEKNAEIFYTLNNDTLNIANYSAPFFIINTSTISAYCLKNKIESGRTIAKYNRLLHPGWKVKVIHPTSRQYSADGEQSFIDGIFGSTNWRKGDWLGLQGNNLILEIELPELQKISKIVPSFLQDTRSWILMPTAVTIQVSVDGVSWNTVADKELKIAPNDYTVQITKPEITFKESLTKFIRVEAKSFGLLPEWHAGAGFEAFIFCDEISID